MRKRTDRNQTPALAGLHATFIDGIALAAAFVWVGVVFLFAVTGGVSFLTAFKRTIFGAIIVYSLVFLALQAVNILVRQSVRKRNTEAKGRSAAEKEPATTREVPGTT